MMEFKVTTTGERSDGTPVNGSYTAKYNGKDYTVAGAPYDSIVKPGKRDTFTTVQKNSSTKYSTTTRAVISNNCKTMNCHCAGHVTSGRLWLSHTPTLQAVSIVRPAFELPPAYWLCASRRIGR
jgi:hypothetical protein